MGTTSLNTVLNITANLGGQDAVETMRSGVAGIATAYDRVKLSQAAVVSGLRGLGAAVGAGAFAAMIKGTADYGEQLQLMSEKTGMSVQSLAKWGEAAELANSNIETVETGFKRLSKTMTDALSGNEKAQATFKALGLDMNQLKNETPDQIMLQLADAFSKMPDGIIKAGLSMQVFGKSGTDMIPILNEGSAAILALSTAATDGFADRSQQFNDNIKKMEFAIRSMKVQITDGILPSLVDMEQAFLDLSGTENPLHATFEFIGELFRIINAIVLTTIAAIEDLYDAFKLLNQEIFNTLTFAPLQDHANSFKEFADNYKANNGNYQKSMGANFAHSEWFGDQNAPYSNTRKTDPDANKNAVNQLEAASAAAKKFQDAMTKLKATDDEQSQALRDESNQLGLTKAQIDNLKDARQTEANIKEKTIGMSSQQTAAYANEARGAEQLREAMRLQIQTQQQSFTYGVQQWAAQYSQSVNNAANQAAQFMQKSFDSMSTGLAQFITGAKVNWTSMIQSMIADLIKLQLEKSIFSPLASLGSSLLGSLAGGGASVYAGQAVGPFQPGSTVAGAFADGGIMTSRGPVQLRKYQSGGIASGPQLAMYGEGSGPEAYVPLPDGRSIPVSMRGGSGDTHMTMNLHLGGGTDSNSDGPNQSKAAQLGQLLTSTVKAVLINEKRAGGLLSNSPVGGS